jgi:hypothetical protein
MQALQSERVGLAKDGFARINLPEYSPNLGPGEAMLAEHGSGEAMLAELGSGEAMLAELGLSLGSLPAPSLRREGGEALHWDLVGEGVIVLDYRIKTRACFS